MRSSSCLVLLILAVYTDGDVEAARFPGFFIPEEWQTILSVFYSHLPPTKIGSDKRFGVGFRLGRNADAQILIELGPQSETQPLAEAGSGFSKRESGKTPEGRRQTTAGRLVNNNTKRQKTAVAANSSASEIENKTVSGREGNNKTADQSFNATTTEIDKNNNTESTTVRKKTKRKRPRKKAKPVEKLTEDRSSLTNNEITTNTDSQKRPEIFLNNFMGWLNRFNEQRNIT